MNILLLGHRGYVGSGLFKYLRGRHRVTGWGREEDLFSLDARGLARRKIDLLINCSVETDRVSESYRVGSPSDRVNVEGARHLAAILKGSPIGWFQISSKDVFGPVYGPSEVRRSGRFHRPKMLVAEGQTFSPETIYAKSKLMAEFISESHPRSNVIRLSTCYTDFDHPKGNWMVKMLRAVRAGKPAPVTADGRQFRDPLHADDLGALIERLADKGVYGRKLNAGGGKDNLISLLEFLRLAAPEAKVKRLPGGDWGFAFDIGEARRLAGWTPRIMIRDRIRLIADNVRQGRTYAVEGPGTS